MCLTCVSRDEDDFALRRNYSILLLYFRNLSRKQKGKSKNLLILLNSFLLFFFKKINIVVTSNFHIKKYKFVSTILQRMQLQYRATHTMLPIHTSNICLVTVRDYLMLVLQVNYQTNSKK